MTQNISGLTKDAAQNLDVLAKAGVNKIEAVQVKIGENTGVEEKIKELEALFRTSQKEIQELLRQTAESIKKDEEDFNRTQELFKKNEEYIHSEDVKVYRNVQAVVVEETEKQTERLVYAQNGNAKKLKVCIAIGVISLIGILADVALNLAQLLNLKLF